MKKILITLIAASLILAGGIFAFAQSNEKKAKCQNCSNYACENRDLVCDNNANCNQNRGFQNGKGYCMMKCK